MKRIIFLAFIAMSAACVHTSVNESTVDMSAAKIHEVTIQSGNSTVHKRTVDTKSSMDECLSQLRRDLNGPRVFLICKQLESMGAFEASALARGGGYGYGGWGGVGYFAPPLQQAPYGTQYPPPATASTASTIPNGLTEKETQSVRELLDSIRRQHQNDTASPPTPDTQTPQPPNSTPQRNGNLTPAAARISSPPATGRPPIDLGDL